MDPQDHSRRCLGQRIAINTQTIRSQVSRGLADDPSLQTALQTVAIERDLPFASSHQAKHVISTAAFALYSSDSVQHSPVCIDSCAETIRRISADGFVICDIRINDPVLLREHADDEARFYVLISGVVTERAHGRDRQWTPKRAEYRPAQHRHGLRFSGAVRLLTISVEGWRRERLAAYFRNSTKDASIPVALLESTPRRLLALLETAGHKPPLLISALVLQFLAYVESIEASASPRREPVERAIRWMQDHAGEQVTPAMIAHGIQESPRSLDRLFRLCTGDTIRTWLLRIRTEHALHLIVTTTLHMKEIAARCGFYDQAHMSNQIRKTTGRTPMLIRAEAHHYGASAIETRVPRQSE